MILQPDLNKWSLSKLAKLDKLYINSASTRFLQRYKINFIEYKNQKFPNNSHIHLRACDAESSYHCTSPIMGPNIPKRYYILNCCSDFARTNAPYLESSEQLDRFFPASNYIYFKTYLNVRYTD